GTLNMVEDSVGEAQPYQSYSFTWNGVDPIRATLCWTDPSGPAQDGLNVSTPVLVNDLDLRVYGPGGAVFYPYTLDRLHPADNVVTGDNIVDNVEQVYIAAPSVSGEYTVEVSHKGMLAGGYQIYALLVSGQASESGGGGQCGQPGPLIEPAECAVFNEDATGLYTVYWGKSDTQGVTYVLQEATDSLFAEGLRTVYTGPGFSVRIGGRLNGLTYYYRVKATRNGWDDSVWRDGDNGCAVTFTCGQPGEMTVPSDNSTGGYLVYWGASITTGVTYVLEEATEADFSEGLRTAYTGASLGTYITDRTGGATYYYRVKATRNGYNDSVLRIGDNGCVVAEHDSGFPYIEDFDGDFHSLENVTGDVGDWTHFGSPTPTEDTGPDTDHSGTGKYLYIESSVCSSDIAAIVITPVIDTGGAPWTSLTFWYHMYGFPVGTLAVHASTDGGATWSENLWSLSGNQKNLWKMATVNLNTSAGRSLRVRFIGTIDIPDSSDMAIDDICIDVARDFGDAADPKYPTLLSHNGARHTISGLYLGAAVDGEVDGQPHADALGDDAKELDDEDGVQFIPPLIPGRQAAATVTASMPGKLDAWVDFNNDGDWNDPEERIFTAYGLAAGTQEVLFNVPATALPTHETFARFRLSASGVLAPTGLAKNGEVEDYTVAIGLAAPVLHPEPPLTPGTSNKLSWPSVLQANEYYVEFDTDNSFATPDGSSGWITPLSYTFAGLVPGQAYYYRARGRTETWPPIDSSMLQTTQA
ncbi:MAG TPA: GEVED domain-containing protein, partial [Candidatus Hydrogenedentes bacterium]|nr:GEVED domain-containing protein [Candidatus Hydrogenedentota bacterium]